MTPNRIVALLTPLVFAPLAGSISALLAHYLPGVEIAQEHLEEVFIAGALIALAKAAQWTRGWQAYEARHDPAVPTAEGDAWELPPLEDRPAGAWELPPLDDRTAGAWESPPDGAADGRGDVDDLLPADDLDDRWAEYEYGGRSGLVAR